jgi:peptide-methionine (S)-S-oxide reductase
MKLSALLATGAGLLALPVLAAAFVPNAVPPPLGRQGAENIAEARPFPDPVEDLPREEGPLQKAVLAGGCFWGMEAVFEHLRGVKDVRTGYAGGTAASAAYKVVSSGATGHAEGIEVVYDPALVSYGQLLKIFFAVAHDPTELNRQGPDVGPQYRSALFPVDAAQRRVASAYIAQLDRAGLFPRPIATTVELATTFHPAEEYHQNFVARNPRHPYVVVHDLPKVAELKRRFPALVE